MTFEQLRIPVALVLIIIAAFIFLPRGGEEPAALSATPSPTIVVGEPGGAVVATEQPTPTAAPTPSQTTTPTPTATPQPPDTFAARVFACMALSGSDCRGQFDRLPKRARSFTALVTFTDARAGDTISVALSGPGGTRAGGPYTLQGGGNGYYYATFSTRGLSKGEYVLTATRNGSDVATATFRNG
jgi:hypothetical protein